MFHRVQSNFSSFSLFKRFSYERLIRSICTHYSLYALFICLSLAKHVHDKSIECVRVMPNSNIFSMLFSRILGLFCAVSLFLSLFNSNHFLIELSNVIDSIGSPCRFVTAHTFKHKADPNLSSTVKITLICAELCFQ